MFSLTNIPSTTTVLSAYTSIAASTMLIRTVLNEVQSMANQFIPKQIQGKIFSIFERLYGHLPSQVTLAIHEYDGYMLNEMFEAAKLYLRTKISPSNDRLRVRKVPREKNLLVTVEKGQYIIDVFEGIQMNWKLNCTVVQSSYEVAEKYFELSFNKKFYNRVLNSYLANVLEVSKVIKEENRILKLYSPGFHGDEDGGNIWGAIKLNHPLTFDTLAMDSELKNQVLDDLDRFVKRREFYRRVGKAWKRGYLLYGPPGTGKSSLIAAMANYLNFNIYDLELANVKSNSELRRLLVATTNRSILVIEDVDCTVQLQDRSQTEGDSNEHSRLTLSGLLNFVDGLWSSCGDERIIVLTTNHKERLDPALLRPGRMDMQIHMSYCTPGGFKLLASNYLAINDHPLFKEVEILIKQANSTPAEIAEELMKSDDAETSLKGLINFLNRKMTACNGFNADHGKDKQDSKRQKSKDENKLERETRRIKRIKTRR